MTDADEFDNTLRHQVFLHQDVIDDSLVNPLPGIVEQLITRTYVEAARRGVVVIQWRIACMPAPARGRGDEQQPWGPGVAGRATRYEDDRVHHPAHQGTHVMTERTYRCGFLIERSTNLLPGRPGTYRVSKDGQSNIIGERFFDDINADSDQAFEEFMTAAIRPDFPHPFMVDDLMADEEPTP